MKHRRTLAAVGGAVALTLTLAACGAEGEAASESEIATSPDAVAPEVDETSEPAEPVVITPDFGDGPWAEEFARAFEENDSPFVRQVLADGEVTEREFVEGMNGLAECLTLEGFPSVPYLDSDRPGDIAFTIVDDQGRPTEAGRGDLDEYLRIQQEVCMPQWLGHGGIVATLYRNMIMNPNNLSWDENFVACLIDADLAPEGFTVAEYHQLEDDVEAMWESLLGERGIRFMPDNGEWGVITGQTITPIPIEAIPVIPGGVPMSDPRLRECLSVVPWG